MTTTEVVVVVPEATPAAEPIPFKEFLESVHPSIKTPVKGVWWRQTYSNGGGSQPRVGAPDIRLHCSDPLCGGERTFRLVGRVKPFDESPLEVFLLYRCSDCENTTKRYSLLLTASDEVGDGTAYKYGEEPSFGVPVDNKLLRLFGSDSETFLKGRRCENQGLGVGAFAYYRRVVENHRNDIFNAIIRVCQTIKAPNELVEDLTRAKAAISFSASVEEIKSALPDGLLINGHNPLLALHGALSIGIHSESDEECLATAQDIRIVLTDLVEKMSILRQENAVLQQAVQRLIDKRK